ALPASEATIQQPAQEQPQDDFDAWAAQQEIDDDYDPALLEQQPWFQAEQSTTSPSSELAQSDSLPGLQEVDDPWNVPAQPRQEEVPAPPAWLDMLTRNERSQSEQSVPAPLTPEPEHSYPVYQSRPEAIAVPNQSWDHDVQAVPASPQTDDAMPPFFFGSDDKDEDMGWPEWLKSLGAEAIEPAPPASEAEVQEQASYSAWNDLQQSLSSTSRSPSHFDNWLDQPQAVPAASQHEVAPGYDPWADPSEVNALAEQEPAQYSSWEEQINQTMSKSEREHPATLETLEQNLLSQGFVPLQPGSLSTIAQESGIASSAPGAESGPDEQPEGNPAGPAPVRIIVPLAASPASTEQLRLASSPSQEPAPEMPVYAPVTLTQQQGVPTPVLASNRVEQATPDTPLSPAYRADALLENELETTMRRPAVRLQPIQKTPTRTDQTYPAGKGRPVDRGAGEGNLSNKERLVKGYQYQLAGAYDDAMQEYRITIRNAPELLGEVISNLRALLKLAPRYTAGFRVLGDAYMRQGEYLQAMEAYNKALTMAKKAKSQSH
ncbi:MAG TPA: hypothetical protein VK134_07715, partial [Ktedonobacteraceae bacterium]|nr:hypothetical protein [Ktedonobacteraceae bacterium]